MAKKRKPTPEEMAEDEARQAELETLVRERIVYHAQKAAEAGEKPIDVERLFNPETRDEETQRMVRERIAHHEAKAREQEEARRRAAG
jgi:hypothetical protein